MNYFRSEKVTMMRSQLHFAEYNPRVIDDEGRKALKRSIKKYGVVDGIVVNRQTNNTIVGGHQKVAILDEIMKYADGANDYELQVSLVDVDAKTEKELNITLNNPNVGGRWDLEKMREILPDIDFKEAGLTEADLSLIGVDYLYKTEAENSVAQELEELTFELDQEHKQEVAQRQQERIREAQIEATQAQANQAAEDERIAHMKAVKQEVKDKAIEKASAMDAYVVISFDTWENKCDFLHAYNYEETARFIKGEDFMERAMPVDYEE